MNKVNIRIVSIGHLPADIDLNRINNWSSEIFNIHGNIEGFNLRTDSDTSDWGYSDKNISTQIPKKGNEEILVVLVSVPLENNYYTRRINNNTVIFTFYETSNILRMQNIPLENAVFRLLYAYSLIYKKYGGRIPKTSEFTNFTHDETRGCIYDMNGLKEDIVFSCVNPVICSECSERLRADKVSETSITNTKNELKKIKKQLLFRIIDWIKSHPIITVVLSSIWALTLGLASSTIIMWIQNSN